MNRLLPPDITCTRQHSGAMAIYRDLKPNGTKTYYKGFPEQSTPV